MKNVLDSDKVNSALNILRECYPDARPELNFSSPFELLIAAILSAQCTDVRVNKVTSELFVKHNTPKDMMSLTVEQLENYIRTCGLYHAKAKSVMGTCEVLLRDFSGEVPKTREELMTLPGVGRKVANVVMSNAFGIPAIAVDTHVFRVANRIGLCDEKTVLGTEQRLMAVIPKGCWSIAHHLIIFHGRRICHAKKPLCKECRLFELCLRKPN